MIVKAIEIRDKGTFIPAVAIEMTPDPSQSENQRYLLHRAGYHGPNPTAVSC